MKTKLSLLALFLAVATFGKTAPKHNDIYADEITSTQPMTMADFCSELTVILNALKNGDLGDLVDYNKPLGLTGSWYPGTVTLTGYTDFVGQSMMGNLFFEGVLANSDTDDNENRYKQVVKDLEACLTDFNKQKSEYGTGYTFVHKKDKNLSVEISYYGKGREVELKFSQY
jgi:hypothetical protein